VGGYFYASCLLGFALGFVLGLLVRFALGFALGLLVRRPAGNENFFGPAKTSFLR